MAEQQDHKRSGYLRLQLQLAKGRSIYLNGIQWLDKINKPMDSSSFPKTIQ